MAKKKFIPPDGENRIRRRFHQLLHQKPKVYSKTGGGQGGHDDYTPAPYWR